MVKVKVKKIHPDAILPKKAHESDAAFDLAIPQTEYVAPNERRVILTGIALQLPEGYCAKIRPRSGFSSKGIESVTEYINGTFKSRHDADVLPGLIDSGFRNEIGIIIRNNSNQGFYIQAGTRLAQMTIERVEPCVMELIEEINSNTDRGLHGFGSTGTK